MSKQDKRPVQLSKREVQNALQRFRKCKAGHIQAYYVERDSKGRVHVRIFEEMRKEEWS